MVYGRWAGFGYFAPTYPLSPFLVLEPCFQFCPAGTPNGFCLCFPCPARNSSLGLFPFRFALRALRSLCLFVTSDSYTLKGICTMLKLLLVNVSFNLLQLVAASVIALAIMYVAFYAFGIVFGLLLLVAVLLVDRVYVWTRRLRDFATTVCIFRNLAKGAKS